MQVAGRVARVVDPEVEGAEVAPAAEGLQGMGSAAAVVTSEV